MSTTLKLNVLLAKSKHSTKTFAAMLGNYTTFFKDKQGAFRGETKTYTANPDTVDIPAKRGNVSVQTTVGEKLRYFIENAGALNVSNLLNIEATNASGTATARLVVGDTDFGELSSLELMRLKGIVEQLKPMYENLPVYSDAEQWDPTDAEQYKDRKGILQGPELKGTERTTVKTPYILEDPNVEKLKDTSKYMPVQASRDTVQELGNWTFQKFTGEISQRQKAAILAHRSQLEEAITSALEQCNAVDVVTSNFDANQLFSFLHGDVQ